MTIANMRRPVDVLNVFCPTGEGGGVDPTCSPGFHGTTTKSLGSILKNGITPQEVKNFGGGHYEGERGQAAYITIKSVFTKDPLKDAAFKQAMAYAKMAAKKSGGKPVVLMLAIPKHLISDDEMAGGLAGFVKGGVKPEWIKGYSDGKKITVNSSEDGYVHAYLPFAIQDDVPPTANAKRRKRNPSRYDPTRTTTLRRGFCTKLRRKFALLKGRILKKVVDEDAFGLKVKRRGLAFNVFCPTGEGGGVDPTCSPSGGGNTGGGQQPKVKVVGQDGYTGKLVHGTTQKSAKHFIAGTDLPVSERSMTYSEWGEDVIYASDPEAPHQAVMFGSHRSSGAGGKRSMVEFRLKDGSKILDLSDEISRLPAMGLGGEKELVEFRGRPSVTDDMIDWLKDKRASKGITREVNLHRALDPTHPEFHPGEYLPLLKSYAKDRGYAAVRTFDETVIVDRSAISTARKLSKKEEDNLRTAPRLRKPRTHAPLYSTFDPVTNRWVVANAGEWAFVPDAEKVRLFQLWLKEQYAEYLIGQSDEALWQRYIEEGFRKGAGRSFDDMMKSNRFKESLQRDPGEFYEGGRREFLRSSFAQPEAVEKVKLLAGRSFDDLENVTADMSARISRTLTDGLVQGMGPSEVARNMTKEVDISRSRAELIARTELIRAHASGQLVALKNLGVEEVGVAVEWTVTEDEALCAKCEAMAGVVFKLSEAEGLIPAHPGCRCAFTPAGVGEDKEDQILSKSGIDRAVKEAREVSSDEDWGPGQAISKDRPESILNVFARNVFCATGEGGGVDPTCSPGSGGGTSSFLSDWTYGKEGVAAGADKSIFRPNDTVIKELASYRPDEEYITVYRSHIKDAPHTPLESWTRSSDFARFLSEDSGQEGRVTLKRRVHRSEVLFDSSKIPADMSQHVLPTNEVVVAHGKTAKGMAKVRKENLIRGQLTNGDELRS